MTGTTDYQLKGQNVKTYIGTKIINAEFMTKDEFERLKGSLGLEQKCTGIHIDGYLVEYTDGGEPNIPGYNGYVSWSPKAQFEAAYRETSGLSFGLAIEALKNGMKVARVGWNGKGMWLSLSGPLGGRAISYDKFWSDNNAAFAYDQPNSEANVLPCITMKTADDSILMGWLASQTDMLAEDWVVLP